MSPYLITGGRCSASHSGRSDRSPTPPKWPPLNRWPTLVVMRHRNGWLDLPGGLIATDDTSLWQPQPQPTMLMVSGSITTRVIGDRAINGAITFTKCPMYSDSWRTHTPQVLV
ncbi:hypothetical protein C1H46_002277 [Malus baccata]|uniref:Uncharacterized protein n=1 Tax=Malus baccata TaxID=106549 RepID=A0A540NM26_MALBA|nr:hypothetical protein C1H46_002277 [Malus baccata]